MHPPGVVRLEDRQLCTRFRATGGRRRSGRSGGFGWDLNYGNIALLWRGGCIIRARFLGDIKNAFDKNPKLENLLLDDFFVAAIKKAEPGWRKVVSTAIDLGLPVPCFTAALSYFDGYRRDRLPANLLRLSDYFGAHTFQRIDKPGTFHHEWIQNRKLTEGAEESRIPKSESRTVKRACVIRLFFGIRDSVFCSLLSRFSMRVRFLGTVGYHPTERRHTTSLLVPELGVWRSMRGRAFFGCRRSWWGGGLMCFITHCAPRSHFGADVLLVPLARKELAGVTVHVRDRT